VLNPKMLRAAIEREPVVLKTKDLARVAVAFSTAGRPSAAAREGYVSSVDHHQIAAYAKATAEPG
jgi:hypothetical protein